MIATPHTDDELQRAWRACRVINLSYEQAMATPALAIAIHRLADCERRRQTRLAAGQQLDHKRAAANDID